MGMKSLFRKLFGGSSQAAESGNTGCLACDSSEVTELAEDVYRCAMCGYEGGDGYPAYVRSQEIAALGDKTVDEVRSVAVTQLRDALSTLAVAMGTVPDPFGDWDFKVPQGPAIVGTAQQSYATDLADRAELARIERERVLGVAQARSEVLVVGAAIQALRDKGEPQAEEWHKELSFLEHTEVAKADRLAALIATLGKGLSGSA